MRYVVDFLQWTRFGIMILGFCFLAGLLMWAAESYQFRISLPMLSLEWTSFLSALFFVLLSALVVFLANTLPRVQPSDQSRN